LKKESDAFIHILVFLNQKMKNKLFIVLGILLIISAISEFFSGFRQVGFNIGMLLGVLTVMVLGYYLIRRGMGKKGLFK
jgi:hypothetical protein